MRDPTRLFMDSHHCINCMCNNTCALVEILGVGNQAKHSSKALREDGMRERRALHDVCTHCIARHTVRVKKKLPYR